MILFFLLLFGVFTLSGAIVFWMELSITNDRVIWLQERLTKLEKDAVKVTFTPPFSTGGDDKITFTGEPQYYGMRTTPEDVDKILNRNNNVVVHSDVKKKPNPKQFDGVKSEEPFVKTRKKRKPKTVGEWEEEIDLGGHE